MEDKPMPNSDSKSQRPPPPPTPPEKNIIPYDLYMGEPKSFWIECKRQAEKDGAVDYIKEIALLRGKNSYYESRIRELNKFMTEINSD